MSKRVAVQIRGTPDDEGDVRLGEFIKQLTSVRKALAETDRIVSGETREHSIDYKVVELHHDSPAKVVLEAVPWVVEGAIQAEIEAAVNRANRVTDTFFGALKDVVLGKAPADFDYQALEAYKDMAALLIGDKGVSEVVISYDGESLSIPESLPKQIDMILGPTLHEVGSITGFLEQINIHGHQNVFTIYPRSNQPRLRCLFQKELRRDAIQAVGRYVDVYGVLKYKLRDTHAFEMDVQHIVIFPETDDTVRLSDLWGVAPDLTGGKSSQDFIRDLRDEWQ